MENESDSLPSIVVPGPELREKVEHFACRLSALDKRKADEMVAKVLASSKRNEFLFVDTSHIFYPYFLSKLTEYRNHPEKRPQKKSGDGANAETVVGTNVATVPTTTVKVGGIVRTEGGTAGSRNDPKRDELLRQAEQEARRYLEDPFPNHYSLDLKNDTVDMPALVMGIMTCTAQYVAKYGDPFLVGVLAKQRHNPAFRFLQNDDVRHPTFLKLVESYKRILASTAEEVETRLENMSSIDYVLGTVCAEKVKYAKAAVSRRKAVLLTDDELRARLHWNTFTILKGFTLNDLLLDGPVPDTAISRRHMRPATIPSAIGGEKEPAVPKTTDRPHTIQPPGGVPVFSPVFMSPSIVKSGSAPSAKRLPPEDSTALYTTVDVDESYTPQVIAPVRKGVDYFVDSETGQRIRADNVQQHVKVLGTNLAAGSKRERGNGDLGLATEDEVARELQRRSKEA